MEILFETLIAVFAMMITGYITYKTGITDEHFNKKLSALVVNVTNPCLMLYSVLSFDRSNSNANILFVLVLGIFLYLLLPLMAKLVTLLFRYAPMEDRVIYELSLTFGNVAFMGIPIYHALYGNEGVFLSVILHLPFNLLVFTYGRYMIAKTSPHPPSFRLTAMINPGVIGAIGSFLVYFFNPTVPEPVMRYLQYVSAITVPASMLIIGASLANMSFQKVIQNKTHILISLCKLLGIPILMFLIFRFFVADHKLLSIVILSVSMPAASVIAMLSEDLDGNMDTATSVVFLTTVLSIVTIPVIYFLQHFMI